jgi:hypothetical protein
VTAIGAERGALLAKEARTPHEEKELSALEGDLVVAGQAFQQFLDKMSEEVGSAKAGEDKVTKLREAQGLMEDLRDDGESDVASASQVALGLALMRQPGKLDDAIKAFEIVTKAKADGHAEYQARSWLAMAHLTQDDNVAAVREAQESARLAPAFSLIVQQSGAGLLLQ